MNSEHLNEIGINDENLISKILEARDLYFAGELDMN